jgi:hypothetical protein
MSAKLSSILANSLRIANITMYFGCGCGFGWRKPKRGYTTSGNEFPPRIIKTTEEYSPVQRATSARFYKSRQVYIDRSMTPSPEPIVSEEEGIGELGATLVIWSPNQRCCNEMVVLGFNHYTNWPKKA